MERYLQECLRDEFEKKYIFPFFWQHGECHEELKEEMDAIYACGIRQVCVESRTHEEFGEEKWWTDFGFILDYAKKLGMKVWLLDDKRFPTGYANGYVEKHPELQMVHLQMIFRDFACVQGAMTLIVPQMPEGAELTAVIAYRLNETGDAIVGEGIDLTHKVKDGLIRAELARGVWRVYYLMRGNFAPAGKRWWIDMLNPVSVQAQLTAVYEPTWEHFAEYFGDTFLGFFSDEPNFANEELHYYSILGKEDMPIPYRDDLCERIAKRCGMTTSEVWTLLPALWHKLDTEKGPAMRTFYMDTITHLYKENFSMLLGDWCRAHNVMYVGHIIEDNGAHMRMGYGPGHYFRALDGQDMGGIDVVLHQIMPGITDARHSVPLTGLYAYPDMFNYLLGKLGSSHGHVDPVKKGRAMCEIYGAFGWAEGLPFMKRLTDHMLVNGINYYVPHAFTPKRYDPDCPPHFYNGGENTQFALFGKLMEYMQRMCHMISDGVHRADVAVLYTPEGEWAGTDNMLPEKVTKTLTRAQIDFDILPEDRMAQIEVDECGKLHLNGETYGALIVPRCATLPGWMLAELRKLSCRATVLFADALPENVAEGGSAASYLVNAHAVPLEKLSDWLRGAGCAQLKLSKELPLVRFYHIGRAGEEIYLFVNDNEWETADFAVKLEGENHAVYDAMNNVLLRPMKDEDRIRLQIAPGAMLTVVSGVEQKIPAWFYADEGRELPVAAEYTIAVKDHGKADYEPFAVTNVLPDITEHSPAFCGRIRYEFVLQGVCGTSVQLDLGQVGEAAELWINDRYAGFALTDPYVFDLTGLLDDGENRLRVEVINNQGYRLRDPLSTYMTLPVSGMLGPVKLRIKA